MGDCLLPANGMKLAVQGTLGAQILDRRDQICGGEEREQEQGRTPLLGAVSIHRHSEHCLEELTSPRRLCRRGVDVGYVGLQL